MRHLPSSFVTARAVRTTAPKLGLLAAWLKLLPTDELEKLDFPLTALATEALLKLAGGVGRDLGGPSTIDSPEFSAS